MRRDLIVVGLIWLALTALAEAVVWLWDPFPLVAAEEASLIDEAFRFLMALGAPVFTFVIAALGYSILRFRSAGRPAEDGRPLFGGRAVPISWFVVTSGLAVFIIFNPGLKGLAELRAGGQADVVIQVEAKQWRWDVHYPQYGVTLEGAREIALPAGRRVKFEVTSIDVIHSLWVPAFRMKIDAVPGMTTLMYVTPHLSEGQEGDFNLRVQCAELCGTGHARMRARIRILDQADFEAWLAEQGGE
jgi:cytochrome c oxidase subunit 2